MLNNGGILSGLCGNKTNNCGCPGSDMSAQSNSMTPESLYLERKQCQNFLDTTKQYYEGRLKEQEELTKAFFDAYKRDTDNSFALYKFTRDSDDAIMAKIAEVDKKVDIMAAIRPYQDALIDNKINGKSGFGIGRTKLLSNVEGAFQQDYLFRKMIIECVDFNWSLCDDEE